MVPINGCAVLSEASVRYRGTWGCVRAGSGAGADRRSCRWAVVEHSSAPGSQGGVCCCWLTASRLQPAPRLLPARPSASVFRLPPFPRNLSPARLDPGSPVGGKAPAFFRLYSFLPGWPSSPLSPFRSLAQAPYPSPLAEFQHPGDFP